MTATTRQPSRCVSIRRRATFADPLRSADGSAAVFLDNQAHVNRINEVRLTEDSKHERDGLSSMCRRCQIRCCNQNPIARKTSHSFGCERLHVSCRSRANVGILQAVTGDRANDPRFLPESCEMDMLRLRLASQHLKSPAMDAALAGSTKIPSLLASHRLRFENFFVTSRCQSRRAILRSAAFAPFPTRRISNANRRRHRLRFFDDLVVENWRRAGGLESNHRGQVASIFRARDIRDSPPNRR